MSVREFDYYSFCGSTYICDQTLLISSVQEAMDTANWAHQRGHFTGQGGSRKINTNLGYPYLTFNVELFPNTQFYMHQLPYCGHRQYAVNAPKQFNNSIINIPNVYDKLALTCTLRKLLPQEFDIDGYRTIAAQYPDATDEFLESKFPPDFGRGIRSLVISCSIMNLDNSVTQPLFAIYGDKNYYINQWGYTYPSNTNIHYDWSEVSDGQDIFTLNLLADIDPTLHSNNFAGAGEVYPAIIAFTVWYRESPDGTNWTGSQNNNGYMVGMRNLPHPQTGESVTCDGVIDYQLSVYK